MQIVSVDGNYYMERYSINEAKLQKELDDYNEKNFDNKEYCITIDDVKNILKRILMKMIKSLTFYLSILIYINGKS